MTFWRISAKTHELLASILCCWRPFCAVGVPADANTFEHGVAGGPAVTGFPAVEGVLAVASVPADPGVHALVGL